jgi:hypothetical protein
MVLDVTSRSLVGRYHIFRETTCLHHQGGNSEVMTYILKMEAAGLSEMLVRTYLTTWRHTPKDDNCIFLHVIPGISGGYGCRLNLFFPPEIIF